MGVVDLFAGPILVQCSYTVERCICTDETLSREVNRVRDCRGMVIVSIQESSGRVAALIDFVVFVCVDQFDPVFLSGILHS